MLTAAALALRAAKRINLKAASIAGKEARRILSLEREV